MRLFFIVKVVGRCRRTTRMTSATTESTTQQRQTTTKAATTTTGHCVEQKIFVYHSDINKFREIFLHLSLCSSVPLGYVMFVNPCTMKWFVIEHNQHELLCVMFNGSFTSYHNLCSCLLIHCDMCYCYQGVYSLRLLFTESIVAGTVDQNQTTEVNTTTTEIPPVELNITECTNHMDCPFYQCCKLKYVHMYYISSL